MKIEEAIKKMNMKGIEKFGNAIAKGQKIDTGKCLISARYKEEDWVKAIRSKSWDRITFMYNSTQFGVIIKIARLVEGLKFQ